MSYPSTSGLRLILVNGVQYRWRFSSGSLIIYGPISGRQALRVDLPEWRDQWLAFPEPVDNQPRFMGPGFVRRAIESGLDNGWQPDKAGSAARLEWKSGKFCLAP